MQYNTKVEAAGSKLAAKRGSVVERATKRVQAVRELQSELKAEEAQLTELVRNA